MDGYIDASVFRPYLMADEYITWSGKPEKIRYFTLSDVVLVPFSLLWCGFAVFWEYQVLSADAPWIFRIWGVPFVCVGLYIVFGRFIAHYIVTKNTLYAVTNRRILFLRGKRLDALNAGSLPPMNVTMNNDGTGTITFDMTGSYVRRPAGLSFYRGGQLSAYVLEGIRDVNRAQSAIMGMERE